MSFCYVIFRFIKRYLVSLAFVYKNSDLIHSRVNNLLIKTMHAIKHNISWQVCDPATNKNDNTKTVHTSLASHDARTYTMLKDLSVTLELKYSRDPRQYACEHPCLTARILKHSLYLLIFSHTRISAL